MYDKISHIVVDVDGTMTDGGIYYNENGNELKKFCTRDAAGFFAARAAGIKIMVITGRKCAATEKRMKELKVDFVQQNVKDKAAFLSSYFIEHGICRDEVGYIGDDLNDIAGMKMAGFVACPADGCTDVKAIAHYISPVNGGYGVVRDVIEYLLRSNNSWDETVAGIYGYGSGI